MKKKTFSFEYDVLASIDELEKTQKDLLLLAISALKNAYAPYSNFLVGAALLFEDGTTVTGNNQENAAYPSGLCAERVAIFYASSQFPNKRIIAVAVATSSSGTTPAPPCGSCRQAMLEYELKQEHPIKLILGSPQSQIIICKSIQDILPLNFSGEFLRG
jgi:cytidine deaminase